MPFPAAAQLAWTAADTLLEEFTPVTAEAIAKFER
jgi:hypothetical protein